MSTTIVVVWQFTVAWLTAAAIAVLMKLWFDYGDAIKAKAAHLWNQLIDDLLNIED